MLVYMYICQDNISECLWRPPQQNFPIFRAGLTKFRLQLLKQYGTAQRDDRPPPSLSQLARIFVRVVVVEGYWEWEGEE